MIVLIHCWLSSAIVIPRKKEEKFLTRGSMERVLCLGSIEDCVDPLFNIKHHNDSYNKRGEFHTPCKCGEVPTPWKHKKIMLIRCWVSSAIMIPRTR